MGIKYWTARIGEESEDGLLISKLNKFNISQLWTKIQPQRF